MIFGDYIYLRPLIKADDTNSKEDNAAAKAIIAVIEKIFGAEEDDETDYQKFISFDLLQQIINNFATKQITAEVASTKVEETNVSDTVKEKVNDTLTNNDTIKGFKVLGYFDINLLVKADGTAFADSVHQLLDEIDVTVDVKDLVEKLPEVAKGYVRTYKAIRIHDGETTVLDATYEDGNLTFKTDRFSDYIVVYSDVVNPATGDNIITYVTLAFISVIGIAGVSIYLKKVNA